ncbi:MAG: hypothetical protein ABR591_15810, partial [Candidatus Velthaea sp.]
PAQPAASPAPAKRFAVSAYGYLSAIDQQFAGPGTTPPEGPAFVAGSIVAPGTPYDYFTNAPLVTGSGVHAGVFVVPRFRLTPGLEVSATAGAGIVHGSGNVVTYWGEAPLPQLNPHIGQRGVDVRPAFTTHNAQDPVRGIVAGIESARITASDGRLRLSGGWIDLAQTENYVFNPPPLTNALPALAPSLPESIGPGAVALDTFQPVAQALPLHGVALAYRRGIASLEAADADLPAPPATPARVQSVSVRLDHGGGLRYGAQVVQVRTGGAPIATTVLWGGIGGPGATLPSVQGQLPFSVLGGQHDTIAGASAAIPLRNGTDVLVQGAVSSYTADGTASAAPAMHGAYVYTKLHRKFARWDGALEAARYEPGYAPVQLPYGTSENVWSISYSWPATWLKGLYPIPDVSIIGPNRQGFRVSAGASFGSVDVRALYGSYAQIHVYDIASGSVPGFVEGYFMPQPSGGGTHGREQHAALALAAHARFADVTLDLTDATLGRPPALNNPADAVAMNYPGGVLTVARHINKHVLVAAGAARYAVDGSFAGSGPKNADLAESIVFAGVQLGAGSSVYHVQYRAYANRGIATIPGGPSPLFHGPQVIFEQRFAL